MPVRKRPASAVSPGEAGAVLRVASVAPRSLGAELGLAPGDELLSINGRELVDFLDWEFLAADEAFLLRARTAAGEEIEFDVERPLDLPLGVFLDPPRIRRCANRCDFCFVDGNPASARRTLLIRDDDYRLSFRHGNFATLSNLKDKDVRRIIEYRLSPLYVSVHATDVEVRRRLLRNPRAPDVLEQVSMFAAAGIEFHAQIVLVPGVNDGPVLERSLDDLYSLGRPILTVSVVPVALTAFSRHDVVRCPTREECRAALGPVRRYEARARRERGEGWVYGADELYILAEEPLPPAEAYDGFPQAENGVGAVRRLEALMREQGAPRLAGRRVLVCTGKAMERLMPSLLETLARETGASFRLTVLENGYYGPSVTTAGLLSGEDFRAALAGAAEADLALLPAESVNDDGLFVDSVPFEDVARTAPMPVRLSYHFTDALAEAA
jgi:putative radical SAM enzyme (TIGR03279 family)